MALKDELETYVNNVFTETWTRRSGQKVPETDDLPLKNEAVELDATVLYADLAGSTKVVEEKHDWVAASIYKSYLYCAAKIIRSNGGVITAYDGDRVMAVFIGGTKNSSAAKTGLQIHWTADNLVMPHYKKKFPRTTYELKQRVGVDTSKLFIVRTGIRGSNDLVWVGNASNHAAKMAALDPRFPTYISADVYSMLKDWAKYGGAESKKNMWTDLGTSDLGYQLYGSTWHWKI
ncbi:MAG TPA: adenylate/guanylate cyclase domain-containing protein [Flexivirga sp.]|uniref:adenylate/guanylate cyclase domain-containing protein n=1 Tax=Flexivirga sp. TaxID=1962927 RepID=UPI002B94BC29|nr:adenylate/guanylate cyclase domain-containing protein [Flexivirga sp.]HWC24678.1 adenylate/guanylate cyclase domain-containing protein [Flexivirga sp.]